MLVLVCYDVSTVDAAGRRRLARVAKACENHGQRVQKSVFECQVDEMGLHRLRLAVLKEVDLQQDSLRIYHLREPLDKNREEYGCFRAFDFEGPIII